jgi:hypothetical protein
VKKLFKRIFKVTALCVLAGIITIAIIILFPQPLFANKLTYKNFTVYSNDQIDQNIKLILDGSLALVQKSELFNSNDKFNIILANNSLFNKIHDKILGEEEAARTTLNNVIIKVKIDVTNNLAFPAFPKPCEKNLVELIAHEIVHILQTNKYGILKFNPFNHPELWKLEGYPEYISKKAEFSGSDSNLATGINNGNIRIPPEKGGCETPDYYYKGWLMVKYLIDIKHQSYDQILKDTISENSIYKEMIEWKNSLKH